MLRASSLRGRSVVDLDSATKLGQVEDVVIDPEQRHVAALVVSQGQALLGERHQRLLPATAIHSIGPDALTVHAAEENASPTSDVGSLPRLSTLVGRKVVSHNGKLLGAIEDVLIDPEDGAIVAYALQGGGPAGFLGAHHGDEAAHVRADADFRIGPELIVVPDNALVSAADLSSAQESPPAPVGASQPAVRWSRRPAGPADQTIVIRPAGAPASDSPAGPPQVREVQVRPTEGTDR